MVGILKGFLNMKKIVLVLILISLMLSLGLAHAQGRQQDENNPENMIFKRSNGTPNWPVMCYWVEKIVNFEREPIGKRGDSHVTRMAEMKFVEITDKQYNSKFGQLKQTMIFQRQSFLTPTVDVTWGSLALAWQTILSRLTMNQRSKLWDLIYSKEFKFEGSKGSGGFYSSVLAVTTNPDALCFDSAIKAFLIDGGYANWYTDETFFDEPTTSFFQAYFSLNTDRAIAVLNQFIASKYDDLTPDSKWQTACWMLTK